MSEVWAGLELEQTVVAPSALLCGFFTFLQALHTACCAVQPLCWESGSTHLTVLTHGRFTWRNEPLKEENMSGPTCLYVYKSNILGFLFFSYLPKIKWLIIREFHNSPEGKFQLSRETLSNTSSTNSSNPLLHGSIDSSTDASGGGRERKGGRDRYGKDGGE